MKRTILAFLCCIFAAAGAAHAGTTGAITGNVTDEKGAPVADVSIRIVSPTDNEAGRTDAHGTFSFLHLPPDTYTVAIEKQGYQPASYVGVPIFADNALALRFKIEKASPDYHKDCFGGFTSQLFKPRVGTDEMNVWSTPFQNYPNPFAMSLLMVPGVLFGGAGSSMH